MVTSAIKDNGDKKISNLNSNENTLSVWNDILNFCLSKKSSHFAINESQTELECLRKQEFSDLIYHRLLHFRKAHVPTKDGVLTDKLSIYAINYACSYNLHSESTIVPTNNTAVPSILECKFIFFTPSYFFIKGSFPLIRLYRPKMHIIVPIITPAISSTSSTI